MFRAFSSSTRRRRCVNEDRSKHIDRLLGDEIVRDLQETPKLRKKPVNKLSDTLLENDGPLIYHCESEEQQRTFESTCRKRRRYLNRSGT